MREIIIIILVTLISTAYGQQADTLFRLEEAIEIALENNFQVKIAKNQAEVASNNNTIGNAGFLPTVDARSAYNRSIQNTEQEFVNGSSQQVDGAKRQVFSAGVDLNWTLFDGTVMFVRKDRLENQSLQAYYQNKSIIDQTVESLLRLYYSVAFEQERQELFQSTIEFSEERLRIAEDKYNLGSESKITYLQARVDLNTDQSAAIQQRELLTSTKLLLVELLAADREADFVVETDFNIDSTLVLTSLLQSALDRNPQILAQELQYQVARQQEEEVRRAALPQIDAVVSYDYSNLDSEAGFLLSNQTTGLNYGLTARMNLFNGFNRRREVANARVQIETREFELSQLENAIKTQIRSTYNTYSNNLQLSQIERQNLEVANENADIALERFKLGVSDALEVREAQTNAVNAQIRYLQSLFNAKTAEVTLKRLSGQLTGIEEEG
jgi:outer membrane protein TolC